MRGKLLAICRLCKEAFSSLPPAASTSTGPDEGAGTGTGAWCGVGKGATIPSDLGYDPDASVSVVLPWQLFADYHNDKSNNNDSNDYLFINDSSKPGSGLGGSEQGDGVGGDAVPIAIAMTRATTKGSSQGQGLSCQLTAGKRASELGSG